MTDWDAFFEDAAKTGSNIEAQLSALKVAADGCVAPAQALGDWSTIIANDLIEDYSQAGARRKLFDSIRNSNYIFSLKTWDGQLLISLGLLESQPTLKGAERRIAADLRRNVGNGIVDDVRFRLISFGDANLPQGAQDRAAPDQITLLIDLMLNSVVLGVLCMQMSVQYVDDQLEFAPIDGPRMAANFGLSRVAYLMLMRAASAWIKGPSGKATFPIKQALPVSDPLSDHRPFPVLA